MATYTSASAGLWRRVAQQKREACGYRPPTEFETLYELGDLTSLVA